MDADMEVRKQWFWQGGALSGASDIGCNAFTCKYVPCSHHQPESTNLHHEHCILLLCCGFTSCCCRLDGEHEISLIAKTPPKPPSPKTLYTHAFGILPA